MAVLSIKDKDGPSFSMEVPDTENNNNNYPRAVVKIGSSNYWDTLSGNNIEEHIKKGNTVLFEKDENDDISQDIAYMTGRYAIKYPMVAQNRSMYAESDYPVYVSPDDAIANYRGKPVSFVVSHIGDTNFIGDVIEYKDMSFRHTLVRDGIEYYLHYAWPLYVMMAADDCPEAKKILEARRAKTRKKEEQDPRQITKYIREHIQGALERNLGIELPKSNKKCVMYIKLFAAVYGRPKTISALKEPRKFVRKYPEATVRYLKKTLDSKDDFNYACEMLGIKQDK